MSLLDLKEAYKEYLKNTISINRGRLRIKEYIEGEVSLYSLIDYLGNVVIGNYLKINTDEILAIGDNLNDLDMVEKAGIGIALNNAYPTLKQIADYTTTKTVEQGGFAEAIYKFIKFYLHTTII